MDHVALSLEKYHRLKADADKPPKEPVVYTTVNWSAFFGGLLIGGVVGFGIGLSQSEKPLSPPGRSATNSNPPIIPEGAKENIPDPVRRP